MNGITPRYQCSRGLFIFASAPRGHSCSSPPARNLVSNDYALSTKTDTQTHTHNDVTAGSAGCFDAVDDTYREGHFISADTPFLRSLPSSKRGIDIDTAAAGSGAKAARQSTNSRRVFFLLALHPFLPRTGAPLLTHRFPLPVSSLFSFVFIPPSLSRPTRNWLDRCVRFPALSVVATGPAIMRSRSRG